MKPGLKPGLKPGVKPVAVGWAAALLLGALSALPAAPPAAPPGKPAAPDPEALAFFEKRVRPVLAESCYACHGPRVQHGGLRLDRPDFLRAGGEGGPVVKRGDPDGSRLVQAVRHTHGLKMPPSGRLPAEQVEALAAWVKRGAAWPEERPSAAAPPALRYRPLVRAPALPRVRNTAWVRTPVDAFILAGLEQRGLKPAPPADRRTLIRRAYYDLTGLPPTAAEVEAFAADRSPDAYPRLVERLLASPRYGERWGRYWLDLARYAETKGYVRLQEERAFPFAFTYRDYVVRSFNEDKPYDRFLLEQLAADQLPPEQGGANLAALGFLTLGRRFTGNRHDILDDRIDVVSRGLLGLTVSCARCHDHKYDPVPTADYYSLYGVFAGSDDPAYPPLADPAVPGPPAFTAELERRKQAAERVEARACEALLDRFRARTGDYLVQALAGRQPPQQPLPKTPTELRQVVVERWIDRLQDAAERPDPVFAPWTALAALPKERFAEGAAGLIRRWKAEPASAVHPRVREQLERQPPASMADVARAYGDLLEGVHRRRLERREAAADRESGLTNGSFEADGPTVNTSLRGWKLTGARLVTLGGEGTSHGQYAAVFADGLPGSTPPTQHGAELTQAVPTQPGATYRLTFDYGAYGSPAPEHEQALRVEVRGKTTLAARTLTARGAIPSVLKPHALAFVADGSAVTLAFADATANGETGRADGVLDNVTLRRTHDAAGAPAPPPPAPAAEDPDPDPADRELLELLYGPASPVAVTRNEALFEYLYDAPVNAEIFRLRNEVGAWLARTDEGPARAHTLVEGAVPRDARILVRGNPQRPGRRVPRQFLAVLSGPGRKPFDPRRARLDLARAIVRPDNPLTARVLVNRVWQHHFGAGLVRTPSDFGTRGEAPTHPGLLDWLAFWFASPAAGGGQYGSMGVWEYGSGQRYGSVGVREYGSRNSPKAQGPTPKALSHPHTAIPPHSHTVRSSPHTPTRPYSHTAPSGAGWSIKQLHRLIMLSSAYQQSSGDGAGGADPENRLVGRMNRRRLDIEALRDSFLAAAGKLDLRVGGPSGDLLKPENVRRTLYGAIDRQNLPGMLRLFDFASPDAHAAERYVTTVPLQGLFLLNSPFMEACSQALADRSAAPEAGGGTEPRARLRGLYRCALARDPTAREAERGLRFLREGGSWRELAQALLLSNEFAFVD